MYTYLYIYITYWQPFYACDLYGPHCNMKQIKKKKKCVQQGFICFKLCNKFQYKMQGKKASSEASLNSCTQDEA